MRACWVDIFYICLLATLLHSFCFRLSAAAFHKRMVRGKLFAGRHKTVSKNSQKTFSATLHFIGKWNLAFERLPMFPVSSKRYTKKRVWKRESWKVSKLYFGEEGFFFRQIVAIETFCEKLKFKFGRSLLFSFRQNHLCIYLLDWYTRLFQRNLPYIRQNTVPVRSSLFSFFLPSSAPLST